MNILQRRHPHQPPAQLQELLAAVLQVPAMSITDDLAMKDVDAWDSLKHIELIVSVEQTFGVELSFDEIVAMQTVHEVRRVLRQRGVLS